jgi:uncharacterized YccA/Bax inhibitor family protein
MENFMKFEMHQGLVIFSAVMLVLSTIMSAYFVYNHGFIAPYSTLAGMTVLGHVFMAYILLTES